jgi:hypothetical protein
MSVSILLSPTLNSGFFTEAIVLVQPVIIIEINKIWIDV